MQTIDTTVTEVIYRTPCIVSVRVAMPADGAFEAGQFLGVTLFRDGAEVSRYLSFSNSPTETDYFEFTKRLTQSDFSAALAGLKPGDPVRIKYPMGRFILDPHAAKHVFLAGGIGITPMRSMWKYAFDRKLAAQMVLIYGNRCAEDIIFRDELEAMAAQQPGCKVVLALDGREPCPDGWQGRQGYIDAAMVREEVPDHARCVFYICGPTAMVKAVVDMLKNELKVPDANIRRESISGY